MELVRASIEEIKEINETNKKNVLNEPMSKNKKNEHRSFNEDEELPAVDFNINLKCGVPCEVSVALFHIFSLKKICFIIYGFYLLI